MARADKARYNDEMDRYKAGKEAMISEDGEGEDA
jgi:hypothetical protein